MGRVLTQSNPHRSGSLPTDGTTVNNYDALGRVLTITRPDGSVISNNYAGNCTTTTDETGKSRESCNDALGRLIQVFEDPTGLNYETDYSYDVLGNLTQVVQKGGDSNSADWRTRTFSYDSLSRLLSATNPESGTITYAYDADSNVLSKTAPAPNLPQDSTATVTTSYTYDVLNRLTQKSYNDGTTSTVKYGYDGAYIQCTNGFGAGGAEFSVNTIGRRNAVCNGSSARMTGYDVMGRVYFDDRSVNSQLGWADAQYGYYVGGEPLALIYPQWDSQHKEPEFELWWDVNGAGNIDEVGTQYHYFLTHGKFDPAGGMVSGNVGGVNAGIATITNSYNSRLQPVNMAVTSTANGATLFSKTYDFHLSAGDNGNVFAVANNKDNNRSQNFTYDSLNRVQTAYTTGPNWGEQYSIDAWGNLFQRQGITGKTNFEPGDCPANGLNQLTTCGFIYDAAGNLTYDGNNTYTYDAENRVIQVNGMAGTWTYVYDGDGERVEKCAGTSCSTTGTIYWRSALDGATLSESDLNVNFQSSYVLVNGKPIGRLDNPSDSAVYYLDDHLGSTSVILDSSANIVSESDYYPYGGEIPIITGDTNRYKFTGKERDGETGLDNFGARYYGSNLGRFMTPDWAARPITVPYAVFGDPQSLNLYGYVRNDPVSQVDVDGHATCANPPSCTMSTIDTHPAGEKGPTITFKNDDPNGKSPNQPVTTKTAIMVEKAVIGSGVKSVNINSTTGGTHGATSNHAKGRAVDIDTVNGTSVRSQGASPAVKKLQGTFAESPDIRENFGPARMEKTSTPGKAAQPFGNSKLTEDHEGHIHESSQP